MIKIQVNIQGFSGSPCSLFGGFDEAKGILAISVISAKLLPRKDGCILITNDRKSDHDSYFDNSNIQAAINSYYKIKGKLTTDGRGSCLVFGQKAMQASPNSVIEQDGIDGNGMRYRIQPNTSNAQIAALAMCKYVDASDVISDVLDMSDEISILMDGGVYRVMTTAYVDVNSQAARVFFKLVSNFSKSAKIWDDAIFYDVLPDELYDITLISRRVYGRPDEYVAVMACLGIDSVDVSFEQKQVAFPSESKLAQFKYKSGFESIAAYRKDGVPTWSAT